MADKEHQFDSQKSKGKAKKRSSYNPEKLSKGASSLLALFSPSQQVGSPFQQRLSDDGIPLEDSIAYSDVSKEDKHTPEINLMPATLERQLTGNDTAGGHKASKSVQQRKISYRSSSDSAKEEYDYSSPKSAQLSSDNGDKKRQGLHTGQKVDADDLMIDEGDYISVKLPDAARSNLSLYEADGSYRHATATYLSSYSWDPSRLLESETNYQKALTHPPTIPKMGTLRGVFLPCLQNIIGIILFVRMPWIIGVAGIGLTLVILLMGISCTLLTTMSMSAIATNGMVAAGGAYYMISRSLGKELGVSVGLLFFLSTSVSIAVYMVGAVEILVDYISRDIGSFIISRVNQTRFFGTLLLMLLTIASLFGMRFSGRASLFFLTGLIVSMVAIYVGIFSSNRPGVPTEVIVGFPGDFNENFGPGFRKEDMNGNVADVDFFKLFAIFFPSVTGIMSGSNRSGSLKEPGVSIPKGTFAAIGTTGILYFLFIALMGTVCTGEFLRTRLSPYGLPVAVVSWPDGLVTLIGCLLTCIGAGLQCLAGASRVMQSIARDDVIPWLSFFKVTHKGEPRRALILTFFIAEAIILIGNLDIVALVSTAFFLVCYASINFSTALLSILKYPHWRPSWKYYHWSLSLLGMILCVTYMFFINWIAALLSLIAVAALYKYVEYTGAQVEWGNGMYALNLHVAQKNLLILEKTRNSSARNWRPQIMCFLDLDENQLPRNPELLSFTSQLRKAGGLSVITSVVVGDLVEKAVSKEISEIYDTLVLLMREQKIEGFPQVLVSKDPVEGRLNALQTVGIGVLRPNTVLMSYPSNWSSYSRKDRDGYVQVLKSMIACEYVVLLLKSDNKLFPFPSNSQAPMGEEDKIDVYWIMHDGGILTLIPYLMRKHRIWRRAKLRIFCVAQMKDNSIQMKADLEALLKRFRIEAEARVVEIQDYDISEFAYEKTIRMQKRNEMLQNMNLLNSQNELLIVPSNLKDDSNYKRRPDLKRKAEFMNTSVKLNQLFKQHSLDAQLILCNLPAPSRKQTSSDYLEYLDVLTAELPRVVLIKGSGMEVITTLV